MGPKEFANKRKGEKPEEEEVQQSNDVLSEIETDSESDEVSWIKVTFK